MANLCSYQFVIWLGMITTLEYCTPGMYTHCMWTHIQGTSLTTDRTPANIAQIMNVSERTVWRYISLFKQTGDIQPIPRRNGPRMLMGDFEQITLLRVIPGIYLQEIQDGLLHIFGVPVSVPTIYRTLKYMGCTWQAMHRVTLQRSDALRAQFMADISVYDPSMFIWLDETGCDRRHAFAPVWENDF